MRALGIDPGTVATGYGIVDHDSKKLNCIASGTIKTSWNSPLPFRLQKIHQKILDLIDQFHPEVMAVEDTFLGKNFRAALKLGQARGMAILAGQQRNLPLFEYAPTAIKLAITGYGAAQKKQIQLMVSRLLSVPEDFSSQHASDALAVAICHLHSERLQRLVQPRSDRSGP